MAANIDKKRKVIHTPFLLEGIKFPPVRQSSPPTGKGYGLENMYIKTSQGFKFTMEAWSRNDKPLPTQIFLHHTAGHQRGDRGEGVIKGWNKRNKPGRDKQGNITKRGHGSTHCIIDKNGVLERCVPENRRCHSEGVPYNSKRSMSVELMALGWFDKQDKKGQWYREESGKIFCPIGEEGKPVNYFGRVINPKEDGKSGFRGFYRYQKYSKEMVKTTVELIKEWCYRYNIKFIFDQNAYNLMFPNFVTSKTTDKATPVYRKSLSGVFTHNSVKPSSKKTDVYPDFELITALRNNFGPKITNNPTVTAFNPSAALPRDVPNWNPTKIQVGNFKGGWAIKEDASQFPIQSPEYMFID